MTATTRAAGRNPEGDYKRTCYSRPRDVEVICYRHNHSAFNGYRRTRSNRSLVRCRHWGTPLADRGSLPRHRTPSPRRLPLSSAEHARITTPA